MHPTRVHAFWAIFCYKIGKEKTLRMEKGRLQLSLMPGLRFWGGRFLGDQGPTCRDIPDPGPGMSWTKT